MIAPCVTAYPLRFRLHGVIVDVVHARRMSAAVFGNEKLAEVVQFLSTERAPATAQAVASGTGIPYSLTRDALRRLLAAGVVQELPRLGGSRGPLYYEIVEGKMWRLFVEIAAEVCRGRRPADI